MNEQELTLEELHRNAIRERLAKDSAQNLERHRMKAMLRSVMGEHANLLAQQIAFRMRPHSAYRLRPWLWKLKRLVFAPFVKDAWKS